MFRQMANKVIQTILNKSTKTTQEFTRNYKKVMTREEFFRNKWYLRDSDYRAYVKECNGYEAGEHGVAPKELPTLREYLRKHPVNSEADYRDFVRECRGQEEGYADYLKRCRSFVPLSIFNANTQAASSIQNDHQLEIPQPSKIRLQPS